MLTVRRLSPFLTTHWELSAACDLLEAPELRSTWVFSQYHERGLTGNTMRSFCHTWTQEEAQYHIVSISLLYNLLSRIAKTQTMNPRKDLRTDSPAATCSSAFSHLCSGAFGRADMGTPRTNYISISPVHNSRDLSTKVTVERPRLFWSRVTISTGTVA